MANTAVTDALSPARIFPLTSMAARRLYFCRLLSATGNCNSRVTTAENAMVGVSEITQSSRAGTMVRNPALRAACATIQLDWVTRSYAHGHTILPTNLALLASPCRALVVFLNHQGQSLLDAGGLVYISTWHD